MATKIPDDGLHYMMAKLQVTLIAIYYIKKFKNISERNLPNVGMGGWIEALANKVHKQGEHIPQHYCYISHNHPYISSSGY